MKRARLCVIVGTALMIVACSDSPAPPIAPSTPTTVTPSVPQVREVTIVGVPANLQIGKTAQLRAAARADDGLQDVTGQATWQSSDSSVCAVNSAGLVEGTGAGTASLTASYSGVAGVASLTCGFVISALVHENAPTTTVTLAGGRIEVVGGPLDGKTFQTDATGRVALPPVSAPGFAIYFKKRGYDDQRLEIFELPRQVTLDVAMIPEPVTQFEDGGLCPLMPSREYRFKTLREGRVRLTVMGSSGVSAEVSPTDDQLQASTLGPQKELLLRPGDFRLHYHGFSCPVGSSWHVRLEYPQ